LKFMFSDFSVFLSSSSINFCWALSKLLLFFNGKQRKVSVAFWSNWQRKISNQKFHLDKQQHTPMLKKLRDAKSLLSNCLGNQRWICSKSLSKYVSYLFSKYSRYTSFKHVLDNYPWVYIFKRKEYSFSSNVLRTFSNLGKYELVLQGTSNLSLNPIVSVKRIGWSVLQNYSPCTINVHPSWRI
jgi:hypothetical protein